MHQKVSIYVISQQWMRQWIDEKLEQDMDEVLDIVVTWTCMHVTHPDIKNRQPIGQMFVNGRGCFNRLLQTDHRR